MRKFVFLDRDGVINEDVGYLTDFAKQWHWCEGAPEALALLHRSAYQPVIVTNQSAVGRGMMTEVQLHYVHAQAAMHLNWSQKVYCWPPTFYCPHAPGDECGCRKPMTGLRTQVLQYFPGGCHNHSWMVGNSACDREFANRVGLHYAHVPDDYPTLMDFVQQLLKEQICAEEPAVAASEKETSRHRAAHHSTGRSSDPL